jgi:hypothetical protein
MVPSLTAKIADSWRSLVDPLKSLFATRERATSEEIAQAIGVAAESKDLVAAAKAAGLEKRRVSEGGQRSYFWARRARPGV